MRMFVLFKNEGVGNLYKNSKVGCKIFITFSFFFFFIDSQLLITMCIVCGRESERSSERKRKEKQREREREREIVCV